MGRYDGTNSIRFRESRSHLNFVPKIQISNMDWQNLLDSRTSQGACFKLPSSPPYLFVFLTRYFSQKKNSIPFFPRKGNSLSLFKKKSELVYILKTWVFSKEKTEVFLIEERERTIFSFSLRKGTSFFFL